MSLTAPNLSGSVSNRRHFLIMLALFLAASSVVGVILWLLWHLGIVDFGTMMNFAMVTLRAVIVIAFLAFGWREVTQLFRRPAKNMGTGLNRIWSVGRTTMLEAWAGRVWLLPILWLIASFILVSTVRPFDESERMPLNIKMLLTGQEWLLLIMMWVMACLSLPRERERKIIMTNASKPLSRLEIVLGKMWGFSLMAGVMVAVMGLASWGILHLSNWRIKSAAAQSYEVQKRDFAKQVTAGAVAGTAAEEGKIAPPSEGTKLLSEEGALFAYNYIPVPKGNLSIVGAVDLTKTPPVRYMKGGSSERAVYRFEPRLETRWQYLFTPVGTRPFFVFYFPVQVYVDPPPGKVQIRVTAERGDLRSSIPPKPVEKVLSLNPQGAAAWEPDDPLELYSAVNPLGDMTDAGPVVVEVQCITPGVLLQIFDGADPDPATGAVPNVEFNVAFQQTRETNDLQFPRANPQTRGFERRNKEEIDGPKKTDATVAGQVMLEQAVWRFSGKDLARVTPDDEGNFDLGFILDTYKADNIDAPTQAMIRVKSFDSLAEQPFNTRITVAEKRLVKVKVPKSCLGNPDPTKRGDMVVMLACTTNGHSISMDEAGCRIELPPTPFVVNLFKSEAVIFLEAVLLIVVSVTCSVRLGWPVALLTSGMCFLFGSLVPFIMDLQRGAGGLDQLNYRPVANPSATYQFFDTATGALWKTLGAIATLVPDFTIYRPQDFIGKLQNMPLEVLLGNFLWTVLFILPFIAVAYLLIRKQELG